MAPHNIADEPTVHSISTTTTAGESNHAMMCCSAVRAVSSLAVWLSVVPFRWTTTPTSSHCALGRAVGKRLYAYTLVQTYPSHTTASSIAGLCVLCACRPSPWPSCICMRRGLGEVQRNQRDRTIVPGLHPLCITESWCRAAEPGGDI